MPGVRRAEVPPGRFAGWLERFEASHGALTCSVADDVVTYVAPDGARAECRVPLPPLVGDLVSHVVQQRTVGLLLVRLGGAAVGVVELPSARLTSSKLARRHVQGRTAAGGWSQQRFARRREGQAREAYAAAAEAAAAVLVPAASTLYAVVTGGDRKGVAAVLEDIRLAALRPLVASHALDVPDPRRQVLEDAAPRAGAVRVTVTDPP